MKLTAQVKLFVTAEQSAALLKTLERANTACNALSEWAWEHQVFGQYALHKARYAPLRAEFDLTAQVVVRCISKVADAYKLDKATRREFRPHGSIAYDERILRWYIDRRTVSIWTVEGRMTLPFACGEPQRELLKSRQGESDLVFHDGDWFLLATCNVEEPPTAVLESFLGVDLGIANIATDSLGNQYSGEAIKAVRQRTRKHRKGLQHQAHKRHSKSAYRHLCKTRRRQSRFVRHSNHCISKLIVQTAKNSEKAIVVEDLKGIRERVSASKQMRWLLGNWAFDQLQHFIVYKARREGVPVLFVPAAYSSQTCSCCGHCERSNRPSQAQFRCVECGFACHADLNAALVLEARGKLVSCPMDGSFAT